MTPRERYLETLLHGRPDRIPFDPGHGRKSTRETWHREGLPPDITDYHSYVRDLLGIPRDPPNTQPHIGVDFRMIPCFEEKIIERRPARPGSTAPGSLIVQDWKGNICEISDEFDPSYLRNAIDFVTRSWIKCPVESRNDWEHMKSRYTLDHPDRFPADLPQRAAALRHRIHPSGILFNGPFWQLREWLGFENLCILFLDDPGFTRDMIAFWQNFIAQILDRIFRLHVPDFILVSEDMAYKEKPMVGPAMAREFLLPCWRAWADQCKSAGVPIIEIDSDGHVGELIPVWIDAGFNSNQPQEVAAGNDLPTYHRAYGKKMAYRGGIDKRAIARGGRAVASEIARLQPIIDAGGYIPCCDHGIPPDVSWPNFLDYCRQLAQATRWL